MSLLGMDPKKCVRMLTIKHVLPGSQQQYSNGPVIPSGPQLDTAQMSIKRATDKL